MQKLTAAEISTALMTQKFSSADINTIISAVKFAQRNMLSETARTFKAGDKVKFTARGRLVTGVVTGRTPKSVKVFSDDNVNWKVSGSLLSFQD